MCNVNAFWFGVGMLVGCDVKPTLKRVIKKKGTNVTTLTYPTIKVKGGQCFLPRAFLAMFIVNYSGQY